MKSTYSFVNVEHDGDLLLCEARIERSPLVMRDDGKIHVVNRSHWLMLREVSCYPIDSEHIDRLLKMAFAAGYRAAKEDIQKLLQP